MPKPNMVNKIWTTSEAKTPASTADQVQPKKALGTVREAMTNSSSNKVWLLNAATNVPFLSEELQMPLPVETLHIPEEWTMTFGRGALLWLLGIPLPVILLLALFWR